MNTEFIKPLQPLGSINETTLVDSNENSGSVFRGVFESAIEDVRQAQWELDEQQYLLATGQVDDAHAVSIAAAEAQLTVDLLVQLRNSAVEAYNEIIRLNI